MDHIFKMYTKYEALLNILQNKNIILIRERQTGTKRLITQRELG